MKIFVSLFVLLSMSAFASDKQVTTISAKGFKEITIGGMLNPFGGAVSGARKIARKELIKKCREELGGTIVGEISYETLRFDEGIMGAIVEATGNCEH